MCVVKSVQVQNVSSASLPCIVLFSYTPQGGIALILLAFCQIVSVLI